MSDKKDKPSDPDPDATVSLPPRKPIVDEDATVSISSRDILKALDEDATVMMPSRAALEEPVDADATVTNLTRDALFEPKKETQGAIDEDATVSIPPGGFKIPPATPEPPAAAVAETVAAAAAAVATAKVESSTGIGGVIGTSPASLAGEQSRIPMIAGGVVVLLVLLYFLFGGGAKTPPEAPKAPATPTVQATAPAAPSAPAAPAASTPSAPSPAGAPSVKDLLAAEIKRGAVAVQEEGGVVTVTIPMSGHFASGSVDADPKLRPILLGIAAALDKAKGSIVVTGHADSAPSSNAKFASNQELSAARGASVAKLMASKLRDPKRISSEGASDSKPLVPGDTPDSRAKNRRVVIVLKPGA